MSRDSRHRTSANEPNGLVGIAAEDRADSEAGTSLGFDRHLPFANTRVKKRSDPIDPARCGMILDGLSRLASWAVPLIDRTDSVLVIVDFQPAFMAQNSMTEDEKTEAQAARARALWLSAAASLLAVPAIVVEEGPERAGKTDPALIERLPPDTAIRVRRTFGIASQTEAIADLTAIRRRTCVLIGFETDTCVGQSAIELLDIGYRVIAVEDAMYSSGAIEHRRGLRRMRAAGTEISDCKGVFFEWTQVVDDAFAAMRTLTAKYGPPPLRL